MSASSATATKGQQEFHQARESAMVINTRRVPGVSISPQGCVERVSFVLEYFETGTRIRLDGLDCVVPGAYSAKHSKLVYIQLGSDKVKPLHPLWSGVRGGRLLGRAGSDCFVRVADSETVTVFFPDGAVAVLSNLEPSAQPYKYNVPANKAFEMRLAVVSQMLAETKQMHGNDRILKEDRNLHELAAIIGMSKRYPDLRGEVVEYVTSLGIPLRRNVFDHFSRACDSVGDTNAWMEIRTFNDLLSVAAVPGKQKSPASGGSAAKAAHKKKERADRDRAERARMKGPVRNDDSNNHRKGKK